MASDREVRRLAAILAADMVGYSRLMEADEGGTIARIKAHREDVIDPAIAEHHGRIVKTTGDGLLVEFASAVDAVRCAVDIQRAMAEREADVPDDRRVAYRIGINIGDIVIDGDDILGDGVNVAARLEQAAPPGDIFLSQQVFDQVENKLGLPYQDVGEQTFKNILRPVHVYRVLVGAPAPPKDAPARRSSPAHQVVRFCTTTDGVQIAYATIGSGPPLVKAANFLSHLEYDLNSPVWRHMMTELANDHLLIRYDERGNGLSDWDVEEISFDAWIRDLEAVIDAIGFEKFGLFGVSQGCAASIRYTVRHPERVRYLILQGGYARGRLNRGAPDQVEQSKALNTLIRQGWGQDNPAFRQFFSSLFIPGASQKQMQWFNDLQRVSASPENAARIREAFDRIDVSDDLSKIAVPTLILHSRNDAVVPFEEGRRMAGMIPNSRFVALESQNHLVLESEPAWSRFVEEVRDFFGEIHGA